MSGLDVVAAVVGISDVAIRSIFASYGLVKDVRDAPGAIGHLREESAAVVHALPSLEFLKTATGDVQDIIKRIRLAEAVNQCGTSCAKLNKDLEKWTKSGDGIVAKLQFVRHKAQVEKCCAEIQTAKGTVVLAVSVASLAILTRSPSVPDTAKRDQVAKLEQEIATLQDEAQRQRAEAERSTQALNKRVQDDEDDLDAQLAVTLANQQKEASEHLWASCLTAEEEIQTLANVDVIVGDVTANTNSKNYVGVPKEVLKMLAQARVKAGNMTASNGSVNRVGIF